MTILNCFSLSHSTLLNLCTGSLLPLLTPLSLSHSFSLSSSPLFPPLPLSLPPPPPPHPLLPPLLVFSPSGYFTNLSMVLQSLLKVAQHLIGCAHVCIDHTLTHLVLQLSCYGVSLCVSVWVCGCRLCSIFVYVYASTFCIYMYI